MFVLYVAWVRSKVLLGFICFLYKQNKTNRTKQSKTNEEFSSYSMSSRRSKGVKNKLKTTKVKETRGTFCQYLLGVFLAQRMAYLFFSSGVHNDGYVDTLILERIKKKELA